jgi:hypothetical protein
LIVFLDTEFTDFVRPQLLSMGLVTIHGDEFYAELDLDTVVGRAREMASSDFVRFEGVLAQWHRVPGSTCPLDKIGRRLGRWLTDLTTSLMDQASQSLLIAFDYSTDYELMESSLRDAGMWEALRNQLSPFNVFQETGTRAGQQAAEANYEASLSDGLCRHHALADARALRASYLAAKTSVTHSKGADA